MNPLQWVHPGFGRDKPCCAEHRLESSIWLLGHLCRIRPHHPFC